MSAINKAIKTESKFCKVCSDAKKSEADFTSHNVKDNTGKVTCPTLLSQSCRYCDKSGHTVKFCGVLSKENKQREREEKTRIYNNNINCTKLAKYSKAAGNNRFGGFESEEKEEEEEEEEEGNADDYFVYPVIADAKFSNAITYASVLTKPTPPTIPTQKLPVLEVKPAVNVSSLFVSLKSTKYKGRWADAESSDDEEDEEEVMPSKKAKVQLPVAVALVDNSAW